MPWFWIFFSFKMILQSLLSLFFFFFLRKVTNYVTKITNLSSSQKGLDWRNWSSLKNQYIYFQRILALAKSTPATNPANKENKNEPKFRQRFYDEVRSIGSKGSLPKKMLAEFSKLVGTLKRRIPATERGILFNDPTRLYYGVKWVT